MVQATRYVILSVLDNVRLQVTSYKLQGTRYKLQGGSEDVLELYPGNAAEARAWLAAFNSPRYLLARGMSLVGSLSSGATSAPAAQPVQIDLWER